MTAAPRSCPPAMSTGATCISIARRRFGAAEHAQSAMGLDAGAHGFDHRAFGAGKRASPFITELHQGRKPLLAGDACGTDTG